MCQNKDWIQVGSLDLIGLLNVKIYPPNDVTRYESSLFQTQYDFLSRANEK